MLLSSTTVSQHLIFHLPFLYSLLIFHSFFQAMQIASLLPQVLWPLLFLAGDVCSGMNDLPEDVVS